MSNNEENFSFRANKENKGLKKSLAKLAKNCGRRLNDYLNIILAEHVKDRTPND